MDIKYIFLLKKNANKSLESKNLHYEILKQLFDNVDKKSFGYKYKDSEYNISYSVYYNNDVNMFKLILSLHEDENITAEILEKIDKLVRKGPIRKDYNIIISNDEVSEYYSNKIHRFLNRFERKLRELVYIIMVKTYGVEWYKKTVMVNKELHGNIKRILKCKKDDTTELIEKALQNMTLHDLEVYLFNPYSESDFNEIFNKYSFEEGLLNSKSKEDIVSMVSACIPKSLWERFFKDIIDIADIETKLEKIRNYRNKVAHCKDFYKNDYIICKDIIEELVNKINLAIEKIETKEFYLENIKEICDAYSSFTSIQRAFEMTSAIKQLQEQTSAIQKAFKIPSIAKQMQQHTTAIQKACKVPSLGEQMQQYTAAMQKASGVPSIAKQMQQYTTAIQKACEVPSVAKIQEQTASRSKLIKKFTGVKKY